MQLKNDIKGFNLLFETVRNYYKNNGDRKISFISYSPPADYQKYETEFLLDRRYVVKYQIGVDREINMGVLALAIGPYYFGAADFWSYKDSERFTLEATTEGVEKNLGLLDEFLGYGYPKKF